jgi:hypothetical protein
MACPAISGDRRPRQKAAIASHGIAPSAKPGVFPAASSFIPIQIPPSYVITYESAVWTTDGER